MNPEAELLKTVSDLTQSPPARIAALRELAASDSDDALAGVAAIVDSQLEIDEVAYEAGWLLAKMHAKRGSLDDVFWANFSRPGHEGFFDSAAELHGVKRGEGNL